MRLWGEKRLKLAIRAAEVALWSWNVDTDKLTLDERGHDLWHVPRQTEITFEELSERIYPSDRNRVRAGFAATRAISGRFEIDFRIMIGEEIRWVSARGHGDDVDMVRRTVFGIFLDVTGRKQAEEGNELLAGEMSHRVKNLLALASGLSEIISRSATSPADMARQFSRRLIALGRAHDLVVPSSGTEKGEALLGDLLTVLLSPYDDVGDFSGRIRVSVPRLHVSEAAATILALIVHELATNSLKYGALLTEPGMLDVSCVSSDSPEVAVVWTERGGPSVIAPANLQGYGSKLMDRSMSRLGGSLNYNWDPAGLIVTLRMTKVALAA